MTYVYTLPFFVIGELVGLDFLPTELKGMINYLESEGLIEVDLNYFLWELSPDPERDTIIRVLNRVPLPSLMR